MYIYTYTHIWYCISLCRQLQKGCFWFEGWWKVDRSVVTPEAWHGSILLHRLHLGRSSQIQASIFGSSTGFHFCRCTDYILILIINDTSIYFIYIILTSWTCFSSLNRCLWVILSNMTLTQSATRLTSSDHPSMEATDTLSRMKWSKNTNAPSTSGGHEWDEIVRFRVEEVWILESQNRREYWNRME